MNLSVKAMKCYMRNGYLYTSDQIVEQPYLGSFSMRLYKWLLGMRTWNFKFLSFLVFLEVAGITSIGTIFSSLLFGLDPIYFIVGYPIGFVSIIIAGFLKPNLSE